MSGIWLDGILKQGLELDAKGNVVFNMEGTVGMPGILLPIIGTDGSTVSGRNSAGRSEGSGGTVGIGKADV